MRDYIKKNVILISIGFACTAWACGDDDDDDGGTGGAAGKGGSAGTAGKGGTGGTAGKGGTGGTAGKGGTGGTAGKGGTGGTGGSAGAPGGAGGEDAGTGGAEAGGAGVPSAGGSAGSPQGGAGAGPDAGGAAGMGGADGGMDAGGAAGMGGADGGMTLAEACTASCDAQSALASTTTCQGDAGDCETNCTSYDPESDTAGALYLAMMTCVAENLTLSAEFACAAGGAQNLWSAAEGTVCDSAVCAWTCDADVIVQDETVYGWCEC